MHSGSKKNAGNILPSSGSFQVRLLLTWSLVSLLLQGKFKLATGNSAPSSQTATKVLMGCKPPQRNYEDIIFPYLNRRHMDC
jgi:hypothetical protein